MIIGIGTDLTNIDRIEKLLARYDKRFVDRLFTPAEHAAAKEKANAAAFYAKRFAAKEACAKALGTGFQDGIWFKDMAVETLPSGQPSLALMGEALKRLQSLTPNGMAAKIHLTLTDDSPWAQAFVVIEAL
ncbi:MAG: holo-ACP synthase [Alphaproteobacteria bacterium]|nr:holo-ACP synthase [Alphaproteobacteria bacterium]